MPFDGTDQSTSRMLAGASRHRLKALLAPRPPEIPFSAPADRNTAALCLLVAARGIIKDERNWVQRTYATASGKYCAMGALRAAAWNLGEPAALVLAHQRLLHAAKARGFPKVERMNDCSTHAEVLTAFDDAIAAARQSAVGMT